MPHLASPQRLPLGSAPLAFLAGSIEMGKATDWQTQVAERMLAANADIIVANPRRTSWDSSWELSIGNPFFREQVEWELDHIEQSDLVLFYFQPGTQSPITLLELGKHLQRPDAARSTLVCCPDGFWRKGNIEIVCTRAGLPLPLNDLEPFIQAAEAWALSMKNLVPPLLEPLP